MWTSMRAAGGAAAIGCGAHRHHLLHHLRLRAETHLGQQDRHHDRDDHHDAGVEEHIGDGPGEGHARGRDDAFRCAGRLRVDRVRRGGPARRAEAAGSADSLSCSRPVGNASVKRLLKPVTISVPKSAVPTAAPIWRKNWLAAVPAPSSGNGSEF